jgi:hypothetical protein
MTWGDGDEHPAGAGRDEDRASPAGFHGDQWRQQVAHAQAAWNAALRRRRGKYTRKTPGYRPGMARKPPPPEGGDVA